MKCRHCGKKIVECQEYGYVLEDNIEDRWFCSIEHWHEPEEEGK
jgi:hypothetical protein